MKKTNKLLIIAVVILVITNLISAFYAINYYIAYEEVTGGNELDVIVD